MNRSYRCYGLAKDAAYGIMHVETSPVEAPEKPTLGHLVGDINHHGLTTSSLIPRPTFHQKSKKSDAKRLDLRSWWRGLHLWLHS